ncbi:cytochrome P450 [Limtongia smithiae]|uniref:cytochrome P450 n=1 Tax=Limtongia smithiae TaxID=1125753 RepID=UPI0034CF53ED
MAILSLSTLGLGAIAAVCLYHLQLRSAAGEPKLVKGNIPFLGAAIAFLRYPGEFLETQRAKYGYLFSIYVAGRKMAIISDPIYGMRQIYSNPGGAFNTDAFFTFVNRLLFNYEEKFNMDGEMQDTLRHAVTHILSTKPKLNLISAQLRESYKSRVDDTSDFATGVDGVEVDLYSFSRLHLYKASMDALFGPSFPGEEIYDDYVIFENNLNGFLRGYPRFMNRAPCESRERICAHLKQYYVDADKNRSEAKEFAGVIIDTFHNSVYKDPKNFPAYMLSLIFATKSNSLPAAFWYIAYIVGDPTTRDHVIEIIKKHHITGTKDDFDWDALYDDPFMVSCFKETTRLTSNVTTGRTVIKPTSLKIADHAAAVAAKPGVKPPSHNFNLNPGETVLIPVSLLHWDPEAYPEPMQWIGDRFLDENQGTLTHHQDEWTNYRPWGGGNHLCPGRFLALVEAVTQAVYMLWYFDVVPLTPVPPLDVGDKWGSGALRPLGDFPVKLIRRTTPLTA